MQHQNDDFFPILPPIPRPQTPPIPRPQTPADQPSLEATQRPLSTPRRTGTSRSTTNVTEHRSIILDQMKDEMVHCDKWEGGFNLYLPDVEIAPKDIEAAFTALKDRELLKDIKDPKDPDRKFQFTNFQTNPANIGTSSDRKRYGPLVKICEVLGGLQLGRREASCELIQAPDSYNTAETPGANFKVDAYLKLRSSTTPTSHPTKIPTADLAVPSEYKKNGGEFVSNRKQLLGTTTFCMNDDPRRMHIYGITIEDSMMNVWYFSRSHSAKSPEFDFTNDPERYVRVMLSLLFATEEELGYDPTIQRCLEANTLCYVYKVEDNPKDKAEKRDRYFKTQGAIFEHRSLCTTGRATRVWKVVEVRSFKDLQPLDDPTPKVLKEVWLDSDSKTEGQNLKAIFAKLKEIARRLKEGDEQQEIFQGLRKELEEALKECLSKGTWDQYFLTTVCDWQGRESKKVPPTAQPDPTLFDSPTSTITPSSTPHSDRTRWMTHQATDPVPVAQNRLPRRYCPKRQYRIIFKEVCEALHHLTALHDAATALIDSVFALQLMFLAGWVHRDISSGNIYVYREGGTDKVKGILADLEYAKLFEPEPAEGSSDPKTGTAFFMAVEIQKQGPLYNTFISEEMPSYPDDDNQETAPESNPENSIGIIHNFEHDMESIFWLLLWILMVRFPPERTGEEKTKIERAVSAIFQNTSLCPPEREQLFTRKGSLKPFLERCINPDLQLVDRLVWLHTALVVAYNKRGTKINDLASYAKLYGYVLTALESCRTAAKNLVPGSLVPAPGSRAPVHVMIKRGHSKVDVGGGDNNEVLSKVVRGERSTDAASSRTLDQQNQDSDHDESGQSAKAS